jgi:hypothetical protein
MRRLQIFAFVLVISLWAVPVALATTVAELPLKDLVSMAPSIVVGVVESSSSRWNEDHSLIVTDVRIRVTDVLKGRNAGEIVITQPGGHVGKVRVDVDGAVAYRPGQETVLFLAPDARGHQQVLGVFRGRFDVATDTHTGKKSVQGLKVADFQAMHAAKPGLITEKSQPSEQSMELNEFLTGLRGMVQNPKGGK